MTKTLVKKLISLAVGSMISLAVLPSIGAAQDKTIPVKIGVGARGVFGYLPLEIAQYKGFYKEEDLDAELIFFPGGPAAATALFAGSVDYLGAGQGEAIGAAISGKPLTILSVFLDNPGLVLAINSNLKDKIKVPADLKGQKIGVTQIGAGSHMALNTILANNGVSKSDIEVLAVGSDTALAAINAGQVAGAILNDPFAVIAKESGNAFWLVDLSLDKDMLANMGATKFMWLGLLGVRSSLANNEERTQRVVNALYKACKYLQVAPAEEVAKLLPSEGIAKNTDLFIAAFEHTRPAFSKSCIPSLDALQSYAEKEVASGFRNADDVAKINLADLIEPRFAEKAAESAK